jgi:hypothetical protein
MNSSTKNVGTVVSIFGNCTLLKMILYTVKTLMIVRERHIIL